MIRNEEYWKKYLEGHQGFTPIYRYNTMMKIAGGEVTFKRYKKSQYKGYSRVDKPSTSYTTDEQIVTMKRIIDNNGVCPLLASEGLEKRVVEISLNLMEEKQTKEKTEQEKKARFVKSVLRARENIFDLIACNVGQWRDNRGVAHKPKFVTLTFSKDIEDIKEANKEFTLFIKRLNDRMFGKNAGAVLKYVCIPELQGKEGFARENMSVWHFHVLFFNLPFIPQSCIKARELIQSGHLPKNYDLSDNLSYIWGNGFTFINYIDQETRAAAYVTKYLSKGIEVKGNTIDYGNDKKEEDGLKKLGDYNLYKSRGLENMKRYQASRGLKKAVKRYLTIDKESFGGILKEYHKNDSLEKLNKEGAKIKHFHYKNEHRGDIIMFNFRLKKTEIPMFKMMMNALCTMYRNKKKIPTNYVLQSKEYVIDYNKLIRQKYLTKMKNLTYNVV